MNRSQTSGAVVSGWQAVKSNRCKTPDRIRRCINNKYIMHTFKSHRHLSFIGCRLLRLSTLIGPGGTSRIHDLKTTQMANY